MIKVLELFAGIGACSKALERIGIEHEIVDAVEIDKYAIKSFNAIHGTEFEVQDITKWDKDVEVDLIMHGSPCQDFSVAGKQAGGDIGSGTRSSLMYETIRIVGKLRPKYVVWENVKNLLSKKHKHNFDAYIETMNILGYNSYYQVLNAKDYGIPQNRERVFTISIRKDIDKGYNFPNKEILNKNLQELLESNVEEKYFLSEKGVKYVLKRVGGYVQLIDNDTEIAHCPITAKGNTNWTGNFIKFEFPPKEELKLRLKDMLEEKVEEKYYLNDEQVSKIENSNFMQEKKRIQDKEYSDTILARDWKDPKCVRIGGMYGQTTRWGLYDNNGLAPTLVAAMGEGGGYVPMTEEARCIQVGTLDIKGQDCIKRVYSDEGLSPTLTDMQGGNRQPKIMIKNATKKGYDEAIDGDSINLSYPESTTRRGRVGHGVAQTLQCNDLLGVVESINKNAKHQQDLVQSEDDICRTIPAGTHGSTPHLLKTIINEPPLRIRKLTPKECWRLMGFDDEDFEKAKAVPMSNTQLYKQAGNSIVVNVLEKIFKNLLKGE